MARLEYTFIGDTVNIASRLESKTKELGTDILISRSVLEKIGGALDGEARFEKAGLVPLKGKAEPMELYKVV
jgi:class 3 adenylate cyclase